ncbi:MAG: alpha/beta hydrolase-fold protein [Chloroflexota bacterium]
MPSRPLYIYLPRGYHEQPQLFYPVIYMQDGQNCFEQFVDDSYAGSWQADRVADLLIQDGLMHECIIVGVGHGGADRIVEYMPPFATFPPRYKAGDNSNQQDISRVGRADATVDYYIHDVHAYISSNFRALRRREYIAFCGSSMGGLFSLFAAWHAPEFVQQVAALSTSFWITQDGENRFSMIEKMRQAPNLPLRVWLDSGTQASPGSGDDGQDQTQLARDVLLAAGFVEGDNLGYFLDVGATHSERAWSQRLDKIFQFLFST